MKELDTDLVTYGQPRKATLEAPLHRGLPETNPRALRGRAGHDRVKSLADARREQQRAGGLPRESFDLVGRVLALSAMRGQ